MQVRKLSVKNLVVGNMYVAYSAKNRLLSVNGDKGVLVKVVEVAGVNIKVQRLGTDKPTAITKLDTRQDAWIYELPVDELQVFVKPKDKNAFPGFSPRMVKEGWDKGKVFTFKADELYEITAEDLAEQAGTLTLRHEGETIDPEEGEPFVNIFLASDIYPAQAPEWRIPRAQRMGVGAVEVALPPKRVSAEDEELIKHLSKALEVFNANKNLERTATFCLVNEKGNISSDDWNAPCHAHLSRAKGGAKYIISGCKGAKGDCTEEMLDMYIHYLTGYSPMADAFLIKDAAWIRENGYVISGDVSAQMVGAACIATRQAWESPDMVKGFYGLLQQGISPNVAFLFGCKAVEDGGKWKFTRGATGHTLFCHYRMDENAIMNFIDGRVVTQNKDAYTKNPNYQGVNDMWGKGETAKVFKSLENISGAKTAWGKAGVSFDDAMEQAADIIDEWAKGAGV